MATKVVVLARTPRRVTKAKRLIQKVIKKKTSIYCANLQKFLLTKSTVGFSYPNYIVTSQPTSIGSDSEQSVTSQCSFVVQPADQMAAHSTFVTPENDDADFYDEDELWKLEDGEDEASTYRPSHVGKGAGTPVYSRKPRFQFTGKGFLLWLLLLYVCLYFMWHVICIFPFWVVRSL